MQYKLSYEPLYRHDSCNIIKNILNGKSIKAQRDEILKKRGDRYKSVVMQFFQNAIVLEDYVRTNIKYDMPGYEENGKQLAEFLFTDRNGQDSHFANVLLYYTELLAVGIDNKEFCFLAVFDDDCIEKSNNLDTPPIIEPGKEFFALLEECSVSDDMKLNAIRLYYNFDVYFHYFNALTDQIKILLLQKHPNPGEVTTSLMNNIEKQIKTDSKAFFRDNFHFTLDDRNTILFYPNLYNVNSFSVILTGFGNKYMIFGLHILDIIETFKNTESDISKAESFLNCLSDSTKLNILKLLRDGPMYGSQLAEKLSCTGANISHHMSTLLDLDVIHVEKVNNRVYFHLDKDAISRHLDDAKGLFI